MRGRAIDAGERAEIVEEGRRADLQVAPMLAMVFTRMPRNVPSLSSASSASVTLSRALASLRKASERVLDPFDRPAGELRRQQHQRRLVEDRRLHAEAAADVAGDDVHLALGDLQHGLRQVGAEREVRAAAGRRACSGRSSRRSRRCSRAAPCVAAVTRLITKRCLTMWSARAKAASAAALSPARWTKQMLSGQSSQTRGAPGFDRVGGRGDGGQRLVVDLDQLGGVRRLCIGLGDHEGDVVADPAHAVLRQRRDSGDRYIGLPSRRFWPPGTGRSPHPERFQSAPVSTASTPGAALACAVSIDLIFAWASS